MSRFIIFGSGGLGRELVAPAKLALGLRGKNDDVLFAVDSPSDGVFDGDVHEIAVSDILNDDEVVIALGDGATRRDVSARLSGIPGILVAPTAIIGPEVVIAEGAVICDYVIVTASATIGKHFQANIFSYVAHDCRVGDFVTLAPRACVNGNVWIEDGAYIGTGAIIKQGTPESPIIIGRDAVVGMGAVVTKSVPTGAVVVGNPAKPLNKAV